jgi:DNA invertase Pin-like site-specific DNA recombinase
VLVLSGLVSTSNAQTRGPGPDEVPSELWKEYPLEEPPSEAREGAGQRRSQQPAVERTIDGETDDGGQGVSPFLLAGALLLALFAIVLATVRRAGGERLGRKEPTPGSAASDRPPGPVSAGAVQRRAPPRPRPTHASAKSSPAFGGDAPAQPPLDRHAALGYVSAPPVGDSKDSVRRQQREIEATCERKGLSLLKLVQDTEAGSGSDLSRPGLVYALERLAAHDASCLVVSSLERLTRSAANLRTLVEWLDRCDARLVVVDIDLDTGTRQGRLGARALATVGGSERSIPSRPPRNGLRSTRETQRLSRQPSVSDRPELKRRIADMRASGMTLQAIADTLNAEGVPTVRGGIRWRPSSVQAAAGYKRPPSRKSQLG